MVYHWVYHGLIYVQLFRFSYRLSKHWWCPIADTWIPMSLVPFSACPHHAPRGKHSWRHHGGFSHRGAALRAVWLKPQAGWRIQVWSLRLEKHQVFIFCLLILHLYSYIIIYPNRTYEFQLSYWYDANIYIIYQWILNFLRYLKVYL